MEGIIPAFRDSLWEPVSDSIKEYGELVLDALLEKEVIREIPIINTISNTCKAIYSLQECHFINQTMSFIESFNAGTADPDKIAKYVQKLRSNLKKEGELDRVLILLDRHRRNAGKDTGSLLPCLCHGKHVLGKILRTVRSQSAHVCQ